MKLDLTLGLTSTSKPAFTLPASTLPAGYAAEVLANGITAQVTFPSFTAPAVYSLTPDATAKITFVVTTPAYTGTTYGTRIRTIVGTAVRRQVHPNGSSLEESQSGSNVLTQFMLSEPIFSADTVLMTVLSGWATDSVGGGGEAAETFANVAITNSSTQSFQKPIVRWNITSKKNYWDGSGSYMVSICAFSIHPYAKEFIASASFTFTDGTNTITKDVTASSLSSLYSRETTNGTRVTEYSATFTAAEVSSFTDGQCYIDGVVRSQCGNNNAESNPSVGSAPDGFGRFEVYLDKAGNRPPTYTVVNPGSAGANPAVHTSRSAALADADGAYATYDAAKAAIATYNNTNHSYNGSGNGYIVVKNGTYDQATFLSSPALDTDAQSVWLTVEAETADSVTFTLSANDFSDWRPNWIKFSGITWSITGDVSTLFKNISTGGADEGFWLDGCTVTCSVAAPLFFYNFGKLFITDCDLARCTLAGIDAEEYMLVRGSDINACGLNVRALIGCRLIGESTGDADHENAIWAFNKFFDLPAGAPFCDVDTVNNVAIVQNVLENHDSLQPTIGVGQNDTGDMENIVVAYNNFIGGRFNYAYNNHASIDRSRTFFALLFNIAETINHKDEADAGRSGSAGDAFTPLYNVGAIGNLFTRGYDDPANTFQYIGTNSEAFSSGSPASITYTSDKSRNSGDGLGQGDYSLATAGDAANRVPIGRAGLRFDLAGAGRNDNGTGAAGPYEA